MSDKKFAVIGNTRWGYCFQPEYFENKTQALRYARKQKRDGYCFAYRIIEL